MPIDSWSSEITLPDGSGQDIEAINFAGGVYCGVYGTHTFYSATGLAGTWASTNYPGSSLGKKIVHDGTKFIVLLGGADNKKVYTGSSLATLSAATNLPISFPNQAHDALIFGSRIVVIGSVAAYTSDDSGVTWATRSYTAGNPSLDASWISAATNGTSIVAINQGTSQAQVSTDGGVNWGLIALPTLVGLRQICWNGATFCAVSANSAFCLTSPDGAAWTKRSLLNPRTAIAANSVGDLVAAGSDNISFFDYGIDISSDNGLTWQSVLPVGFQAGVAYGLPGGWCVASDGTNFVVTKLNNSIIIVSSSTSTFWTDLVNCVQT